MSNPEPMSQDPFEQIANHPDNQDLTAMGRGEMPIPGPGTAEEDLAFHGHPDVADMGQHSYPMLRPGPDIQRRREEARQRGEYDNPPEDPIHEMRALYRQEMTGRAIGSILGADHPDAPQSETTQHTDHLDIDNTRALYQQEMRRPRQRLRRFGNKILDIFNRS